MACSLRSVLMATETRVLIALGFASVLVGARPTWADTFTAPAVIQRADDALAAALPFVFHAGKLETRSVPAFASARHAITLGELQVHVSPRLSVRAGAGLAQIVDAPTELGGAHTGCAVGGSASYALFEPHGLRVGLELSAMHVTYGTTGFTDETMLVALSTR